MFGARCSTAVSRPTGCAQTHIYIYIYIAILAQAGSNHFGSSGSGLKQFVVLAQALFGPSYFWLRRPLAQVIFGSSNAGSSHFGSSGFELKKFVVLAQALFGPSYFFAQAMLAQAILVQAALSSRNSWFWLKRPLARVIFGSSNAGSSH